MVTRFGLFLVCCLSFVFPQSNSPKDSTRVLIHLLDYLAQDYAGAVRNGAIVSQAEYEEQKEFIEKAWNMRDGLRDSSLRARVEPRLGNLKSQILAKGESDSVRGFALSIKNDIIASSGIATAPSQWPSLAEGKRIFAQTCATCHGPSGHGDSPSAGSLNPKPANFQDDVRMSALSPFQVFNTVRLGVDGTAMPAFSNLTEQDIWSLAFYVLSMRYQGDSAEASLAATHAARLDLHQLSLSSDKDLLASTHHTARATLAAWRLQSGESAPTLLQFLRIADSGLDRSLALYRNGDVARSADTALFAYLDGIEPLEPRLRANDPRFVASLESAMMNVRSAIRAGESAGKVEAKITAAKALLIAANEMLESKPMPGWALFLVTMGILLRESFEALLVIIAILGVIKATNTRQAAPYVHGGWVAAVLAGFAAWFFSGWLEHLSGAGRELTESISSLFAVAVLLYMGFWMHGKSEIGKWTAFINSRVNDVLNGKSLFGLGFFSFIVVFREAFETVLFLSALNMEGDSAGIPILAGVLAAMALTILVAWLFLRASARLPVRLFFSISSFVMAFLAVVLAGKGIHALQEAGHMSVTSLPWGFRFEFMGIFPTYETALSQGIILLICVAMLSRHGKGRVQRDKAAATTVPI